MSNYPRITAASKWLWQKSPTAWRAVFAASFVFILIPAFVVDTVSAAIRAIPDWWDRFMYLSRFGRETVADVVQCIIKGPGFGEEP